MNVPLVLSEMDDVVKSIAAMNLPSLQISIDGFTGCRKSTLSRLICDAFDIDWVEVDRYVARSYARGMLYSQALCIEKIMEVCNEALSGCNGFVVDGICTLEIFEMIGLIPTLKVYIDRRDIDTVRNRSAMTSRFEIETTNSNIPLHVAMSLYHKKYRPKTSADVVYVWDNVNETIY